MHKLILWDIDGTLLRTLGAGMRAMRRAAATLFGEALSFDGVEPAGNLDPLIVADAARRSGVDFADHHHATFRETYRQHLTEELSANTATLRVMPGVKQALETMRSDERLTLGLLTGNYRVTAQLKLAACGIDPEMFLVGAFGDDGPDRPSLVPIAMRRFTQLTTRTIEPHNVILIGDTPKDVHAAHTHGCKCIAVATGPYNVTQLRETGADLVMENFDDAKGFWEWIGT